MQEDFHYYATYCAAYLAGHNCEESSDIAYAAQFVDLCTRTLIEKLKGPLSAATTQSQIELADARTDLTGLMDITRIWASFHFLPGNLYARKKWHGRRYMQKYRLICNPNSALVAETVKLARGKGLEATGLAMHVLADTWAHRYFAGTPSFVINNASEFTEIRRDLGAGVEKSIQFIHNPTARDDLEKGIFTNTVYQNSESSIMNLGHGRAGHLPDYSFMRYKYLPAWGEYEMYIKDNPSDYWKAFCQMVYAMKYLRGERESFEKKYYEEEALTPHKNAIKKILEKRQKNACEDWKAFGKALSGRALEDFDIDKYQTEYLRAAEDDKDQTFLGRFFLSAMAQKSMVTNRIFISGSRLAGVSVDYNKYGFGGIRDYWRLAELRREVMDHEQGHEGI